MKYFIVEDIVETEEEGIFTTPISIIKTDKDYPTDTQIAQAIAKPYMTFGDIKPNDYFARPTTIKYSWIDEGESRINSINIFHIKSIINS